MTHGPSDKINVVNGAFSQITSDSVDIVENLWMILCRYCRYYSMSPLVADPGEDDSGESIYETIRPADSESDFEVGNTVR